MRNQFAAALILWLSGLGPGKPSQVSQVFMNFVNRPRITNLWASKTSEMNEKLCAKATVFAASYLCCSWKWIKCHAHTYILTHTSSEAYIFLSS